MAIVQHLQPPFYLLGRHFRPSNAKGLTAQRQVLRKDLRRLTRRGDPTGIDEVKQNIRSLSGRLRAARKEVALR